MTMVNIAGEDSSSSLSNIVSEDVQPNACDLRIGKVFAIKDTSGFSYPVSSNRFVLSADNRTKIMRPTTTIHPERLDEFEGKSFFILPSGIYEVIMQNEILVGHDEAGFVITRSTLNRNGVFLTSGLYDSGYDGIMAAVMHVNCGPAYIEEGARIGQYLSWKSLAIGKYDGSYGKGKQADKIRYSIEE